MKLWAYFNGKGSKLDILLYNVPLKAIFLKFTKMLIFSILPLLGNIFSLYLESKGSFQTVKGETPLENSGLAILYLVGIVFGQT